MIGGGLDLQKRKPLFDGHERQMTIRRPVIREHISTQSHNLRRTRAPGSQVEGRVRRQIVQRVTIPDLLITFDWHFQPELPAQCTRRGGIVEAFGRPICDLTSLR